MSYDYKLITKTYSISYTGLTAGTIAGLGTVDIAKHNGEHTENLIKIELSFGTSASVGYVSAELHVLLDIDENTVTLRFVPSNPDYSCGDIASYPIGTSQYNARYSHLLFPSELATYFEIFIPPGEATPHPQLPEYWQLPIYVSTPNYPGHVGAIITTYYPSFLPTNHDY
jgi:hypothetical protein